MRIPVLLYHGLYDAESNTKNYDIRKDEFDRQLSYLHDNGFVSCVASNFKHCLSQSNLLSRQPILLTFDDGGISDYTIGFPLLKKYNFISTFFITTDWIGREGYLTWDQLQEMVDQGMSIQSHGKSHSFLSDLDNSHLSGELRESRNLLGSRLKQSIDFISIPGGFYSRRVLDAAKRTGYHGAFTSDPGFNDISAENNEFLCLRRFVITQRTSFEDFKAIVHGDKHYLRKLSFEHSAKVLAKRMLGSKVYYMIWSAFLKNARNDRKH